MPCHSSHMEPTWYEKHNRKTAEILIYVQDQLGLERTPEAIQAAASAYGGRDWTPVLCGLLRSLPEDQRDALVYNARSKDARKLADWWEQHQDDDRRREAEEEKAKKREAAKASGLAKLTEAERKALGLHAEER